MLAIVKARFAAAGRLQLTLGDANIAAGGRVTDIDLEAFLDAGRRNSERQSALAPDRSGARQRRISTG
jgi:hypothetical protein